MYAHAEGQKCAATNSCAHAEGYNTQANGNYCHTEGYNTQAVGDYSHAQGYGTKAISSFQHVLGKYNTVDSSNTYLVIVGNGTGDNVGDRSNAATLDWSGNLALAGGIILTSPNGTKYKITVANDGTLNTESVS